MITIIALTTLASMSLTACSQTPQSSKDEEKKEENQTTSSSHSHFHGTHTGTVHVAAKDRQARQYTNQKSQPKNSISQRGAYNPAPSQTSGGISRGWFGRFFGSIFGG